MKKGVIILLMVSAIIIILFIIYIYTNQHVRQDYIKQFNQCQNLVQGADVQAEIKFNPQAKECFDSGGCYLVCGSGCRAPKQKVSFFGMFDFYFGNLQACPDVCTPYCLYDLD